MATTGRKLAVDVLFVIFGISAWISVHGIYVELPVLVNVLPEGWNLPSYVTMIIQTANVGIIIYGGLQAKFPKKVNETSASFFILAIGLVAAFLLIFFWDITAVVGGGNHSIGLFILGFFLALLDCTSTVTYIPFAGRYKPIYMMPYLVGEGLSGFLPAIVALGQGGGEAHCVNVSAPNTTNDGNLTHWTLQTVYSEPKFTVEIFFSCLFVMMCASMTSLTLLNVLAVPKGERVSEKDKNGSAIFMESSTTTLDVDSKDKQSQKMQPGQMKRFTFWYLATIEIFLSLFVYGVLFSLQSYSCLPYGNTAYHLSATLSNLANPAACFVAIFTFPKSVTVVTIHSVLTTLIGIYILVLASLSPTPPLVDSGWGSALVIIAWISCIACYNYSRAGIVNIMGSQGKRALFWLGVFTQFGALIGAIITFLLVNVYKLFKSYDPCAEISLV